MLDEAIAKAKERAKANCRACQLAGTRVMGVGDHTCDGDLAAVRDVALALIDEAIQENMTLHMVRQRRVRLEAEINRQFGLPEGSEGGHHE